MKAVIEGFNKANPNITINQTVVPYDDYQTKIAASVPAGTGPDVAMSYFGWIPLWAKQGFIVPLPDSVAKEVESQFVPFAKVTNVRWQAVFGIDLGAQLRSVLQSKASKGSWRRQATGDLG